MGDFSEQIEEGTTGADGVVNRRPV